MQNNGLLKKAYSHEELDKNASNLMKMISQQLQIDISAKAVEYQSPEEELNFWKNDFSSPDKIELTELLKKMRSTSMNFHSKGYVGHQVAITLPITVLTSAFISYLNNSTTIFEVGMAGNAMEKVVIIYSFVVQ